MAAESYLIAPLPSAPRRVIVARAFNSKAILSTITYTCCARNSRSTYVTYSYVHSSSELSVGSLPADHKPLRFGCRVVEFRGFCPEENSNRSPDRQGVGPQCFFPFSVMH